MKKKISIYSIISYLLFFALIKPMFLPAGIRKGLKVLALVIVFLFCIKKAPKSKLVNISLLYCAVIILCSSIAFIQSNIDTENLEEALLYALEFYDLYTFGYVCSKKHKTSILLESLFQINALYCMLSFASIMIVGTYNNSNNPVYLFGNKFTTAYLFISLVCLFVSTHPLSNRRNRIWYFLLSLLSLAIVNHLGCMTAVVSLCAIVLIGAFPSKLKHLLLKPGTAVVSLIASSLIVLWISNILGTPLIHKLVFDVFGKSVTVTGRVEIYEVYLKQILSKNLIWGYGYGNDIMRFTSMLYSNAQNGLLQIFLMYGIVGVAAVVYTTYHSFEKNHDCSECRFFASLIVYAMIIASVFEVAVNWFFLLGLTLVRWVSEDAIASANIENTRKARRDP